MSQRARRWRGASSGYQGAGRAIPRWATRTPCAWRGPRAAGRHALRGEPSASAADVQREWRAGRSAWVTGAWPRESRAYWPLREWRAVQAPQQGMPRNTASLPRWARCAASSGTPPTSAGPWPARRCCQGQLLRALRDRLASEARRRQALGHRGQAALAYERPVPRPSPWGGQNLQSDA